MRDRVSRMPTLDLSDSELQQATQACRIAAVQAEQDAAKQSSPTVRASFDGTARRYRALAEKLGQCRQSG